MLNQNSLDQIAAARLRADLDWPQYQSYSFANIPQLVRSALVPGAPVGLPEDVLSGLPRRYQKVILFLLDGFGWSFFSRYAERFPFLKTFIKDGVASKLTSQFPSTTSVHLTTLHTGAPLASSGVVEWWYYEPQLEQLFAPLLFATKVEHKTEHLRIPSAPFFPATTLYQDLAANGVKSVCFQHRAYANSPFSQSVTRGARVVPFKTIPEALVTARELLHSESERLYTCIYFDVIDSISHQHGPNSSHLEAEIEAMCYQLERFFLSELRSKDALILITADHGQTSVGEDKVLYLDTMLPKLEESLQTNSRGQKIFPAGGPRDTILHIKEGEVEAAFAAVSAALSDRADVFLTREVSPRGIFGVDPTQRLRERTGDILILPRQDFAIGWAAESTKFHYKGHHGGLSPNELEIPLLALARE